jgi:hypothetical protein
MTEGSAIRTFWYGVLHAIGAFDLSGLTDPEKEDVAGRRTWFWLGEVTMAGVLAATIAVPAGIWFAGRTELPLAFIGAAVLFLPLFVYLPKVIRLGMRADTDAASKNLRKFFSSLRSADFSEIEAFGKNEQVKKVFWTLFVAMAGLVPAQVLHPVTAQQIVGVIMSAVP